jgi:adenylate cyclase
MADDERATLVALDAARTVFRTQIEAHQGCVIDMADDSVLAVFDSAFNAVDAALLIQQSLGAAAEAEPHDHRMHFRIGVHLGDVIETHDGTVHRDDFDVVARLAELAEPGGITVSEAVRAVISSRVSASFLDQGEQQLKTISVPSPSSSAMG